MLPALQSLGKAILGDKFYEFLFGKEGEKGLFSKAAEEIGKFYAANVKPFFDKIAKTETFKSLMKYFEGISDGMKEVGVALGVIDKEGNATTAAWYVGAAAFAALFALKGPFKLLATGLGLMGYLQVIIRIGLMLQVPISTQLAPIMHHPLGLRKRILFMKG